MRAPWLVLLVACGARTDLGGERDVSSDAGEPSFDAPAQKDVMPLDVILPEDVSVTDVAEPPPPPPPDFAWYKLDETSGSIAHDSTPNHYDVTMSGGVTWGNGAAVSSSCGVVDVSPMFRTAPLTITGWLTPAARSDENENQYALTPYPPSALSGDVPALGGFGIGMNVWTNGGGGSALVVETGVNAAIAFHSLAAAYDAGTRYFVAIAIDVSQATIFVDAQMLTTVSADTPPPSSPVTLHLGCHNDDGGYGSKRFFQGVMRDMRVYKRLVGAAEITALFANGPV